MAVGSSNARQGHQTDAVSVHLLSGGKFFHDCFSCYVVDFIAIYFHVFMCVCVCVCVLFCSPVGKLWFSCYFVNIIVMFSLLLLLFVCFLSIFGLFIYHCFLLLFLLVFYFLLSGGQGPPRAAPPSCFKQ